MAIDNANLTDYVSLRRLKEYHDNVVLNAIENAGKVNDVGYMNGSKFTSYLENYTVDGKTKQRAVIQAVSSTAAGLMTPANLTALNVAVKSVNATPSEAYKAPSIDAGVLYLPNASTADVTAGLLSNDDYKKIQTLYNVLGNEEDTDTLLNTLNDVFTFLADYSEEADLLDVLNKKANLTNVSTDPSKPTTNTFTVKNVFSNDVSFSGSSVSNVNVTLNYVNLTATNTTTLNLGIASTNSTLPALAKYIVDDAATTYYSYLPLGNNKTYGFKFHTSDNDYSYYLPAMGTNDVDATVETGPSARNRYLTAVMCYNEAQTPTCVISKAYLRECPPITASTFS